MLAPATTEHRLFFTSGEEAFLFEDLRDCIRQANAILQMDKTLADKVRQQARQRSLSGGYSYRDRARMAFGQLQSIYA